MTTDTEAAKVMIEKERQERIKTCVDAIQVTLTANHCQLVAVPQINPDGRIIAIAQVSALD